MNLAQQWRHALCDAAVLHGPQAPTLCEGWDVRDLLAHLSVRDRRPDAVASTLLPATAGYAQRLQRREAAGSFDALVRRVRSGPPGVSPSSLRALDRAVNTTEFLVHHEDIVRGSWHREDMESQVVREIDPESSRAAWQALTRTGRLLYRHLPVGLVVVAPGVGRAALRRPPSGAGSVVLTGRPLELLVHAFGRGEAASVRVDGDPASVAAFAGSATDDKADR